jgi:succinate dehydrogenase / fumarate reductase, flavoprotein subunit
MILQISIHSSIVASTRLCLNQVYEERVPTNRPVHFLATAESAQVLLSSRPVRLDPLTTLAEGGIDLKRIALKARVY